MQQLKNLQNLAFCVRWGMWTNKGQSCRRGSEGYEANLKWGTWATNARTHRSWRTGNHCTAPPCLDYGHWVPEEDGCVCYLTGRVTFALIDFLTVIHARVNKGPRVGLGILWAVLPRAVMFKPESHGLELGKKWAMLMMRLRAVQRAEARLRVVITSRAR